MPAVNDDCSLLAHTRQLLRSSPRTYLEIYLATGLSPNWLSLVANDKITDPSVNSVQKLYEFLSACPLQVG